MSVDTDPFPAAPHRTGHATYHRTRLSSVDSIESCRTGNPLWIPPRQSQQTMRVLRRRDALDTRPIATSNITSSDPSIAAITHITRPHVARLPSASTRPLRRPGGRGLTPPLGHMAPHGAPSRCCAAGPTAGPAPTAQPGVVVRPGRTVPRYGPWPPRTPPANEQDLCGDLRPPSHRYSTQVTVINSGRTRSRTRSHEQDHDLAGVLARFNS